ncbi:choline dehydrogenase [Mesorhizobium sp. WSM4303]|uniref:GMC family oxidoreductase n=1 Tax=unclassified Mesorhizobium TaxID=325217 RepID=UPI00115EC7A8|nr:MULTISPECIES: GMC family oxidoreductase N-terminal domain-containing protein [unclassified Mesorhizobium]TRC98422.1 choline dehydrogenase [Mesorhizobium sp. WSM4306]TRC99052.1 choline dehydrogenase [Mesorhizobium sp. WSM4303]
METAQTDYVIVGGGTAGCVLAAKLTEDPKVTVVMLEAGPHHRGLLIHMPAAIAALYDKGTYHWAYRAQPESFADCKVLPYKMGRIVGGSSAINGLVWARGNPLDYDDWATSGCPGWSYDQLEPVFRRIEAFEEPGDVHMGHHGPIPVTVGRPADQMLSDAFIKAAAQAGERINPNHNSGDQEGFCALHRNTRGGLRGDVYQGYVHPVRNRPNLKILPGQTVRRILFDGLRAIGVEAGTDAHPRRFLAGAEVLLCAGAIASPQLLEVSGIGDPAILARAGITPFHDLPGVGENFHTHPTIALTFSCKKPVSILNATRGMGKLLVGLRWILMRTGPAATNHFEAGAFLKSHACADRPDYQLTFLPLALSGTTSVAASHGFQVYIELIGCKSRGRTHVTTPDIATSAAFCFNYLQDGRDMEVFKKALAKVRQIVAQPAFEAVLGHEIAPGAEVASEAEIEAWIRKCASISHHLVGSCKMGPEVDPMAVVDSDLRVRGLDGLRVIDASIMPKITSANTHATTIAIAERAATIIRGRRLSATRTST